MKFSCIWYGFSNKILAKRPKENFEKGLRVAIDLTLTMTLRKV